MDVAQIRERIGCSSISFRHLPLFEALDEIHSLGFSAVDIGAIPGFCPHIDLRYWTQKETEELAAGLRDRKLRLSSLNVNVAGMAIRYDSEIQELFETYLKIGADLRARVITLPVPPAVPEENWLSEAQSLAGRIRHLSEVGAGLGLQVSVEAPHTGTLASTYAQSARLYELINDSRVGATFDTSHGQFNDTRPVKDGLAALGTKISHVHLRDVLGKSFGVTPGKGVCDFLPFLQNLATIGYQGDLNLELETGPAEANAEAIFARDYFKLLLDGKPLPPEFAIFQTEKYRSQVRFRQATANPKGLITSMPVYAKLQPLVKPILRIVRENRPHAYYRYESSWQKRYLKRSTNQVRLEPGKAVASGKKLKRVAILGCGNIGRNMHGPAFANHQAVEIVGVCDNNLPLAVTSGQRLNCPAFRDFQELVSQTKPDLVANCTTEAVHGASTIALLEKGVDVFCEKIMAESLATGAKMVRCAKEHKRVLGVNYNWRFQPGIRKLHQLKQEGALGKLCLLRFVCHAHVWNHVLDLVNFLAGRATNLTAQSQLDPLFEDRRPWRRFADELLYLPGVYTNALIRTVEGVGVSITSSNLWQPDGYLLNIDAVFRRGTVSLSGINPYDVAGKLSSDQKWLDLQTGNVGPVSYAATFQSSIEAFMKAYLDGERPPTNGDDGLFVMRMENAAVESSKTGRTVNLD